MKRQHEVTVSMKTNAPIIRATNVSLADTAADMFTATIEAEPSELEGCSAKGFFIRPDGGTVEMDGEINGSKVSVTLPEECYAVEGVYTLAVKIENETETVTVAIFAGYIVQTRTDTMVDNEHLWVSLQEIVERLNNKLNSNQGAANAGKFMSVNASGELVPVAIAESETTIIIDDTLSVPGAAAEAAKTGDEIERVESKVDTLDGAVQSGDEDKSAYHLGLYIDADGDICQLGEV